MKKYENWECSGWQDNDCICFEGKTKCLNWIEVKWQKKAQDKGEKWINIEWFRLSDWSLELDEFESVVESGSNGLNFLFSGKVGLFLRNGLYSCSQGLDAHTIREVPVLDVIIMNLYLVEFFWLIGEAFGCDLVFTNFIFAFTCFKDVACFNRVSNNFTEHDKYGFNPVLEELLQRAQLNLTILQLRYHLDAGQWQYTRILHRWCWSSKLSSVWLEVFV